MANKLGALCLVFLFLDHAYGHLNLHNDHHNVLKMNPSDIASEILETASEIVNPTGSKKKKKKQHSSSSNDIQTGSMETAPEIVNPTDSKKKKKKKQHSSNDIQTDSIETASETLNPTGSKKNKKHRSSNDIQTDFMGKWEIASANAGISAMHLIVLPNNKAVMFDSTVLGPSELQLPKGNCRVLPDGHEDCWAHASEFDIETGAFRPLKVNTDTWCSSGGLNKDGILVQAGGWLGGGRAVRYLELCETCDWKEYPDTLSGQRWYSTQQVLPDGGFIVVGGRGMMNYEFIPPEGKPNPTNYQLPLLRETTDDIPGSENNLYPHVHLSTDGNLFIMANYRAILYDPKNHKVIREFPQLPGGSRNYPGSAPSAVLPLRLDQTKKNIIHVEVAVCGGGQKEAYRIAETKKQFVPALQTCGKIRITNPNAKWKIELMPAPRVMADMMILPTGDLLIINGAKKGASGWEFAEDPYFSPVLYRPSSPRDQRFKELQPTTIPRMYHSTAAVLPDGKILVAGSSTHNGYKYTGVKYPTELRVEKFSPPYLDPSLATHRPAIVTKFDGRSIKYQEAFFVEFILNGYEGKEEDLMVTMYSPPFTTHGYSMNQRLLVLVHGSPARQKSGTYQVMVKAPPNGAAAPPGFHMLFVVYRGIPSKSVWVKLSAT